MMGIIGCSAGKPALYPNDQYQKVGAAQADRDIADCEAKAQQYVKSGGEGGREGP